MFAPFILSGFASCDPATAADSAAGQKAFESVCAACHQLMTFAGKSESDLVTQLNGIVASPRVIWRPAGCRA
jgi:mono/diheme cytochrome c family protein